MPSDSTGGIGEDRRKHLELIQAIISRLAGASFQIKGWTVTIVTALLGVVVAAKLPSWVAFVGLVPALIFWFLDAYYLHQERLYRDLYNRAFPRENTVPVFSMAVAEGGASPVGYWGAFRAGTIWPLHAFITLIVVLFSLLSCITTFPPP